jgi:hypothetical protein
MSKFCTKCGLQKDVSLFSRDKYNKDGLKNWCKSCCKEYATEKRKDPDWAEHLRKYQIQYSASLTEEKKDLAKQSRKEWTILNRESLNAKMREYRKENPEYFSSLQQKYYRTRRADINFRLGINLRVRLNMALKNDQKAGSAVDDLGCTVEGLREHLESKFKPGMTWENWGLGEGKWHIDHIVPLSAFDLSDRQHLLLACNYLNLQPLWQKENLSKGNRY